jgi:5-methylthioadenosine/S-adenosylhomocysteine deaminase
MMGAVEGRIVIRNGVVPPAGAGATLVIEGTRITALAAAGRPVEARPGDWEVDADGRLVVPGLIDCHTHLALGGLVRLAGLPGRPLPATADLRAGHRRSIGDRAAPELLEPLARAGALAALQAGVTSVLDLVRAVPGSAAEALAAEARGVAATGLRAVLAFGARGRSAVADLVAGGAFAAERAGDPRVRGQLGVADLSEVGDDALALAAAGAARYGLQVCAGEDEADLARVLARHGQRPIELLAERGLLGPRTVVAHAGTAAQAEGILLAGSGAVLAVTPRAAMFLGAPLPPFVSFTLLGVPVVFGTDGLFPDVAGEALAATLLHRHAERSAGAAAELVGGIAWPAAGRLLAGIFAAPAGTLEVGALADVVILDWRPTVPLPALPGGDLALLWAGARAAWVIVDGEVRLREGRLLGGDEAEIAARAREAAAALLSR